MGENINDIIDDFLTKRTLIELWPQITSLYDFMRFTDPIEDRRRIEEYTYITDMYNKFVGTLKSEIHKHNGSIDEIEKYIDSKYEKLERSPDVREKIVYVSLRDSLMYAIKNLVVSYAAQGNEEEYDAEW